ncbi:CLUMA_CG009529, isoform A [Clunio marinus]|uniref:CLUMA_CG009529, isoform A n=1 Tax=Clunio marinus TaxID=568069 RepID=A0A1J1I740_9DIPT|nr:CLUMA_CG009529, isoform A [Clunio marinus]
MKDSRFKSIYDGNECLEFTKCLELVLSFFANYDSCKKEKENLMKRKKSGMVQNDYGKLIKKIDGKR